MFALQDAGLEGPMACSSGDCSYVHCYDCYNCYVGNTQENGATPTQTTVTQDDLLMPPDLCKTCTYCFYNFFKCLYSGREEDYHSQQVPSDEKP